MAKHRSTLFAVVRKIHNGTAFEYSGLIGVYLTLDRAEEIKDSSIQQLKDQFPHISIDFEFEVSPVTYYEE